MKSLILKMTFFLCLFVTLDLSAQCTPSKSTIKPATKATTKTATHAPAKKATAKKPATKTTTPANVKTNTDVITVGPAKTTTAAPAPATATAAGAMPVMTFDKKTINFGNIKTGDRPEVIYNFTNTGNAPLDIDIVSGCDCTELDWTRSQVPAGGKGFVKAIFKSDKAEPEDHKKQLKKYVDIVLKQMHPKSGNVLSAALTFEVFIVD